MTHSRTPRLLTGLVVAVIGLVLLVGIDGGVQSPIGTTEETAPPPEDLVGSAMDRSLSDTIEAQPAQRQRLANAIVPGFKGRLLQDGRPLVGVRVRTVAIDGSDEFEGSTSDAGGVFTLLRPRGGYDLVMSGSGVPRDFIFGPVWLADGQQFDVGDVSVPRPGSIRGRVIDERDQPLTRVRVFASVRDFRIDVVDPASPDADPNVLTGGDGRFTIGNLRPGMTAVRVEHPGYRIAQRSRRSIVLGPGGREDIGDFLLRRASALRGFVLSRQGVPIANARVTPMDDSSMFPRQAVFTAADGGFQLTSFDDGWGFLVEKAGFATHWLKCVEDQPRPVRIELGPAPVIRGVVRGAMGRGGTLRVRSSDSWFVPRWRMRSLEVAHPIALDGSFCIVDVPKGRWKVTGVVPGVGRVSEFTVELPREQPLELRAVADRTVSAFVVDDLGTPVASAALVRSLTGNAADAFRRFYPGDPGRENLVADADGRATLRIAAHDGLQLTAHAPGHLGDQLRLDAGAVPATVQLVLRRGGVLRGRIVDPALVRHARVRVHAWRKASDDEYVPTFRPDSRGRFSSEPLVPGTYTLTISLRGACAASEWFLRAASEWFPRAADPVPLLRGDVALADSVTVEIVAGQVTQVALPSPRCREVHGRVLAGGRPVAGAVVLARVGAGEADTHRIPLGVTSSNSRVLTRTDAEGRFRFLSTSTKSLELRARHARGATWSTPVIVQWKTPHAILERDIVLRAAAVRGTFRTAAMTPIERLAVHAELYPLADASRNPWDSDWTVAGSVRLKDVVPHAPLDRFGAFAFECLPPGGWVLRIVGRDGILWQRVLRTRGDEVLELGRLELPVGVAPRFECGLAAGFGVLVRQVVGGRAGVFLRAVTWAEPGGMAWGTLTPGLYQLRAVAMRDASASNGIRTVRYMWIGDPVGTSIDVEVHADGSCTPAVVWPAGIKK